MNQAGGLALPATITLGKLWKTLSSGSLSRKPLPLLGVGGGERWGQRTSGEKVRSICQKFSPQIPRLKKKKEKILNPQIPTNPETLGARGKAPRLRRVERPSSAPLGCPGRRAGAPEPPLHPRGGRGGRGGAAGAGAEPADRGPDGTQPATEPRAGAGAAAAAAGGRGEAGWGWGRR